MAGHLSWFLSLAKDSYFRPMTGSSAVAGSNPPACCCSLRSWFNVRLISFLYSRNIPPTATGEETITLAVRGLTPNTLYICSVVAENMFGLSDPTSVNAMTLPRISKFDVPKWFFAYLLFPLLPALPPLPSPPLPSPPLPFLQLFLVPMLIHLSGRLGYSPWTEGGGGAYINLFTTDDVITG